MISFSDDNYNAHRENILNNVIIIYDVVLNYMVEGDMGAVQPASPIPPIFRGVAGMGEILYNLSTFLGKEVC